MKEKIKKLLLIISMVSTSLTLKAMDTTPLKREESNRTAVLCYCTGKEKKLITLIQQSQKTNKSRTLILSDQDSSIQATILPLEKKVILSGPGFIASELFFPEFLKYLNSTQQSASPKKSKKRCEIQ